MANTKKKKQTTQKKAVAQNKPMGNRERTSEIIGVCLICFGIIFGIAVYADHSILLLNALHMAAFGTFGILGYLCPILIIAGGILLIFLRNQKKNTVYGIFIPLAVLAIMAMIHLCGKNFDYSETFGNFLRHSYQTCGARQMGGGAIAALVAWPVCSLVGRVGGVIFYLCILLICLMMIFNISIRDVGKKLGSKLAEQHKALQERKLFAEETEGEEDLADFYDQVWEESYPDEPEEMVDEPDPWEPEKPEEPEIKSVARDAKNRRIRKKDRVHNSYLMEDISDESYSAPILREEPEDQELKIIGKDLTGKFETTRRAAKQPSRPQFPQLDSYEIPQQEIPQQEIEIPAEEPDKEEAFVFDDADFFAEEPKLHAEQNPHLRKLKSDPAEVSPKNSGEKPQYQLPPVSLLSMNKGSVDQRSAKNEIEHYSGMLESTLESFGVYAKVINAERGPKVTRYELQPAPGVKISKILNLEDDIALNLAAESIRIVAPIPGKAAVGIELPNKEYASVMLRELVDTQEFKRMKGSLVFALGKDIMGQNVYADLKKMPHLLVAGTTGSGKSVCLNTIIMSMLYRSTPDEVKLMMIDPKRGVEMAKYNGLPNLIIPVVIEPAKAAGALQWAVSEMITRYKQFNQYGSKDLESYNEKLKQEGKTPLHKLVIVIDEFADLMMVSSKEVEDAVCRIAQLGRASGIHLIIATQSPRADIFTGLIKANVPSRIALTVGNALESRIIMDAKGAEQLLGNGDMLFRPIGKNKPIRVQGCWVSDPEIEAVVDFLKENCPEADYDENIDAHIEELAEQKTRANAKNEDAAESSFGDDLTKKAIEIAAEYEGVSASMLQRRLRVGYARAARLVDELEELGVVGPADGSKPRQLLLTREDCIRLANADEFLED